MTKRAFGELESEILYFLRSGEPKTVKDVQQALGGHDNYNTIMTVMARLAEKKQLSRTKVGLQYQYTLLTQEVESPSLLKKMKQKFFGVKTSTLVNHFIETADDLTEEDLEKMEKMLQQVRESKK